jgi:hypothetical protein
MTEPPTLMLIGEAVMTAGWYMIPITLKTKVWKEGRERIAGSMTKDGKTVSG